MGQTIMRIFVFLLHGEGNRADEDEGTEALPV
jgi:hypothetical protein